MKTVLSMWLVLVAVAASTASAGVAEPPTKTEDGVSFGGLNTSCPGFTTPEVIPIGAGGLADLWATVKWRSVVSDTGLKVTTLHAKDTDAAGVRFAIEATFSVQGSFVEGLGWVFTSPLFLGSGTIEVVREDRAKISGTGSFDFSRGGGHWSIGVDPGATCTPPKH